MIPEIETYSGRFVDPLNLRTSDIAIEDIAHALAMKTRFTGHGKRFISIAEHSVNVSCLAGGLYGKVALLHDASEAYLPDVPSPLKQNPRFAWFKEMENKAQDTIYERFEVDPSWAKQIKWADTIIMAAEAEANLDGYQFAEHWAWVREFAAGFPEIMKIARNLVRNMLPDSAEALFLTRWQEVNN